LASTLAALLTAILLLPFVQNVWVLLISLITEELTRAVGSYVIAPWRPVLRIHWDDIRELNRFGRWVVAGSIIIFLSLQLDNIIVGKVLGATALGLYEVAFRISQLPATQISQVASTVAFPALSSVVDQPDRFRTIYLRMVTSLWLVNLSVGGVIIVFAAPIVYYLLGDQWQSAIPVLRILAVAGIVRSTVTVGGNVFYAAGVPKYDVLMNIARLITMSVITYPFVKIWGIEGAAYAVLISISLVVPLYLILVERVTDITPWDHLVQISRLRSLLVIQ
jgi:O-antigen/teichoic acid export membrane protein